MKIGRDSLSLATRSQPENSGNETTTQKKTTSNAVIKYLAIIIFVPKKILMLNGDLNCSEDDPYAYAKAPHESAYEEQQTRLSRREDAADGGDDVKDTRSKRRQFMKLS